MRNTCVYIFQTPTFFVKDTLKSYCLMQFLVVLLTSPIIYIVKAGGQYFFVYLWLFAVLFTLFFMTIYPDVIAPLFDKYTPLEDGELKQGIEDLASTVQFPLKKIYVVEGKKLAYFRYYLQVVTNFNIF